MPDLDRKRPALLIASLKGFIRLAPGLRLAALKERAILERRAALPRLRWGRSSIELAIAFEADQRTKPQLVASEHKRSGGVPSQRKIFPPF